MQTDIWSLGCVVYEMLMLRHAFQAASINKLAEKIVQGRQAPHSSIQSYPSVGMLLIDARSLLHVLCFMQGCLTKATH